MSVGPARRPETEDGRRPEAASGRRPAAAVPLAPSARQLAGALVPRRRSGSLPDRVVEARGVRVDPAHLDAWVRVCGSRPDAPVPGTLPGAFCHVLASGASMRLLLDPAFPLPLLGMVHVAQRLEVLRPVDAREPLDLAVTARDLRPHRRGRQLDVVATASVAGELVWRGTSTYLHREAVPPRDEASPSDAGTPARPTQAEPGKSMPDRESRARPADTEVRTPPDATGGERRGSAAAGALGDARRAPLPDGSVRWTVPAGTGRAYAAVSGDPNPIHLSRPTARLLGFRRPIAHGMWTLAHALLDLEGRVPAAHDVSARFLRPLSLPGRAVHGWRPLDERTDGALLLAVRRERDGEPHLVAEVTPR
ncbi:MaoC/PaaZ C-terminal domain-containing protein [uncultured Pseudokineococcus sp.]|uniref:MaoC/PaaZ C-terminal domain-containing protein n=1 Tax=uncultured Pseudokineococcus sp. TaxID=1642928 RepID=UPI002602E312|nr:MaoC/PaaZ C-terminal domain-containing protein [uncultured Pseudokineococcus sp.]